ncbi:MAG: HAMP domain-containing histidine kinase [Rhodospirillales bacterium]|nr:HAMP domain-containing histidine kinase [Rhodospirillales bacterium]
MASSREIRNFRVLAVVAALLIIVVIAGGAAIGVRVSGLFLEVSHDWTEYQDIAQKKEVQLSRIRRAFGYGGFIHNFKNYVLRQDDKYVQRAKQNMADLRAAIAGYRALPNADWETSALAQITAVVDDYDSQIANAIEHVRMGSTPTVADETVNVDDALAFAALDGLEAVWQQSQRSQTERISGIVAEGRRAVNLGVGLIPVIILCGLGFFLLLRKLAALTEEKMVSERRLQESEAELRELNELKNKFLGIAAHDLRNPINVIGGMSQMIIKLDLADEKKKEFIETINRVSGQMLNLLNDLLDISAIESGNFTLRPEMCDVADVIAERVDLIALNAETKNIEITTEIAEVPQFAFDRERVAQVLDNLLGNAIKFSPEETTIHVTAKATDGFAWIAIQDQGPGIPAEERDRLFGTFERLSVQPTGGEKSTGLGLAIVKKIVEAHDGEIFVESELGTGTCFTVALPLETDVA